MGEVYDAVVRTTVARKLLNTGNTGTTKEGLEDVLKGEVAGRSFGTEGRSPGGIEGGGWEKDAGDKRVGLGDERGRDDREEGFRPAFDRPHRLQTMTVMRTGSRTEWQHTSGKLKPLAHCSENPCRKAANSA